MTTNLDKFSTSYAPTGKGIVTGKGVGDFDFLAGNWHIRHKKLKDGTKGDWQHFDSSANVHRVLGGWVVLRNCEKLMAAIWGWGSASGTL